MKRLILDFSNKTTVVALPKELQEICSSGWKISPIGAYVLRQLYTPVKEGEYRNRVAYFELENNEIKIPDGDLIADSSSYLREVWLRAFGFTLSALRAAEDLELVNELNVVISIGIDADYMTHGSMVRIFTRREPYPDHSKVLEEFTSEAMAIVGKSDFPELERMISVELTGG